MSNEPLEAGAPLSMGDPRVRDLDFKSVALTVLKPMLIGYLDSAVDKFLASEQATEIKTRLKLTDEQVSGVGDYLVRFLTKNIDKVIKK